MGEERGEGPPSLPPSLLPILPPSHPPSLSPTLPPSHLSSIPPSLLLPPSLPPFLPPSLPPSLSPSLPFSTTVHLGSGQFGTVSQGVWSSPTGSVHVAVKTLKPGCSEGDKIKFLQEAAINGQFRHPNIVKLIGVVTIGQPVSIYCCNDSSLLPPCLLPSSLFFLPPISLPPLFLSLFYLLPPLPSSLPPSLPPYPSPPPSLPPSPLPSFLLVITCSSHVNIQRGVGCHWWFNYLGPLLNVEFELSG